VSLAESLGFGLGCCGVAADCGNGYLRWPLTLVVSPNVLIMVVVLVLETEVPTAELMLPNPVAGNFEVVVPGHLGSAVRSAARCCLAPCLTSLAGKSEGNQRTVSSIEGTIVEHQHEVAGFDEGGGRSGERNARFADRPTEGERDLAILRREVAVGAAGRDLHNAIGRRVPLGRPLAGIGSKNAFAELHVGSMD